jgi:hypothetical protein
MALTYEPIATTSLSSGSNPTVSFTSIPQTYTDLRIVAMIFGDDGQDTWLNFNSDTASNYNWMSMESNGTALNTLKSGTSTQIRINNWQSYSKTGYPVLYTADIFNYTNTVGYKSTLSKGQGAYTGTTGETGLTTGVWRNTAAITSVQCIYGGTILANSTFTLYGIKAA